MVRVSKTGLDQYTGGPMGNDWYKTQDITCPRCGCVFRLDEYDFEVNGPNVGTDLAQHYHWNKTDRFFAPLATTVLWPDGISGNCPWCDFYPISILSAAAGLVHPATVGDPALGILQGYVTNNGVTKATFWRIPSANILVALLLLADNSPYYGADATHQSQIGVSRSSATTFTVPTIFYFTTPAVPVPPATVRIQDSEFAALFDRLGVTII